MVLLTVYIFITLMLLISTAYGLVAIITKKYEDIV